MSRKRTSLFLLVLMAPFSFAQNLEFRADTIPVADMQLAVPKCIQIGLYVTNTDKGPSSWAQITATLDYSDPSGYLNGTPFVKSTNFQSKPETGITDPAMLLTNNDNQTTSCLIPNVLNVATQGLGPAALLATGTEASSLVIESLNSNTGRIVTGTVHFSNNNFTLMPGVEYLFAIVEFPIAMPDSQGSFAGLNGISVNFTDNNTVPDGNIVTDGINVLRATTQNGGITFDGSPQDNVGVFRPSNNFFYLDVDGNRRYENGTTDILAIMGAPGDSPFTGNWNGGAFGDDLGLHRTNGNARFFLDTNNNDLIQPGDRIFYMGATTDIPIRGDWNNGGSDKVGLFRPSTNQFFLDVDDSGSITGADVMFFMGAPGDLPLIGDWDGDGADNVGIFRPSNNAFFLDIDGSLSITGSDIIFGMGATGDIPLVGDWNGDTVDHIGLFRPSNNRFFLDMNNDRTIGAGDTVFGMGAAGDIPLVGRW